MGVFMTGRHISDYIGAAALIDELSRGAMAAR
jgi:hypothetical protein